KVGRMHMRADRLALLVPTEGRRHPDVGLSGAGRYAIDPDEWSELVRELAHHAQRGVLACDVHDAATVRVERGVRERNDYRALGLEQFGHRGPRTEDQGQHVHVENLFVYG